MRGKLNFNYNSHAHTRIRTNARTHAHTRTHARTHTHTAHKLQVFSFIHRYFFVIIFILKQYVEACNSGRLIRCCTACQCLLTLFLREGKDKFGAHFGKIKNYNSHVQCGVVCASLACLVSGSRPTLPGSRLDDRRVAQSSTTLKTLT